MSKTMDVPESNDIDQLVRNEEEGLVFLKTSDGVRFTALLMDSSDDIDILQGAFPDYINMKYKVSDQEFNIFLSDGRHMTYSLGSLLKEEGFFENRSRDVYSRNPDAVALLRIKLYNYSKRLIMFGRIATMTPQQVAEAQLKEKEVQRVYESTLLKDFRLKMMELIRTNQITVEDAQLQTSHFKASLTSLAPAKAPLPETAFRYPLPALIVSKETPIPVRTYRKKNFIDLTVNSELSHLTPISSLSKHL